jgi:hypothetical protein
MRVPKLKTNPIKKRGANEDWTRKETATTRRALPEGHYEGREVREGTTD